MLSYLKSKLRPLYHRLTRPAPYSVEKALLAGRHHTGSQQPSVLHFSLNKAATQYTKSVLHRIAAQNNLTPVGMNEWAFGSTQPYLDHLNHEQMEGYKHVFKPRGYLYSVFGGMVENIDNLEAYRILLMVRDPRDILVSSYYSTAFSHPLPGGQSNKRGAFEQKRDWAKSIGIDEYVLAEAPRLLQNFARYQSLLLARCPNAKVMHYENMITDFEGWLDKVLIATGCHLSQHTRNKLMVEHHSVKPIVENKQKHLRKGVAGDYLEKLQTRTVATLDALFAPLLPSFGYDANL